MIKFFDFSQAPNEIQEEWLSAMKEVIRKGTYILGKEVETFESEFASKLGIKCAIGVGNGLDGLELALLALEISRGKRVGLPAHTFIATWLSVIRVGAEPVGIDVDKNGLLSLDDFESKSKFLDAVIPVHMHGSAVDIDSLRKRSQNPNIVVIEDASQAHFLKTERGYVGTEGDIAVFSLYPTKNLGALGDAGIVATDSEKLALKIRKLRNYGSNENSKYIHDLVGRNSRLDEIQAAILRVNLRYATEWNDRRVELSNLYLQNLSETHYVVFQEKLESIRHHFCLLVTNRSIFRDKLSKLGIETDIHYPNLAAWEVESLLGKPQGMYPMASKIASEIISLPLSQWMDSFQIEIVIKALKSIEKI